MRIFCFDKTSPCMLVTYILKTIETIPFFDSRSLGSEDFNKNE